MSLYDIGNNGWLEMGSWRAKLSSSASDSFALWHNPKGGTAILASNTNKWVFSAISLDGEGLRGLAVFWGTRTQAM
jgi:hypothetical protein